MKVKEMRGAKSQSRGRGEGRGQGQVGRGYGAPGSIFTESS